jgi:site-specific recombinase XerC
MLTNSVFGHTRRAYAKAFDDFLALAMRTGQPVCRQLFQQYRAEMVDAGLGSSTINVRLSAVRKLVREARENGLVDPSAAARIVSVPNVPAEGVRLGQWLTVDQTRDLLAVPDRSRLKGKRDHAILAVLTQSALRRDETSHLDMSHIQKREGRWVLADIRGKRGRVYAVDLEGSSVKSSE